MEDGRIWEFEQSLWTGDAANYRAKISDDVLMALPHPPFVYDGEAAVAAVSDTPRWGSVEFTDQHVSRPQHGLIVIAYTATAMRDEDSYEAHCTTVMHLDGEHDWKVIQHQQTPRLGVS